MSPLVQPLSVFILIILIRDDDEDRETEFADIGEELNSEIEQLRDRVTAILESYEGESEDQGAECLELLTAFTDSFTREWRT